jgi:hypothetical protein
MIADPGSCNYSTYDNNARIRLKTESVISRVFVGHSLSAKHGVLVSAVCIRRFRHCEVCPGGLETRNESCVLQGPNVLSFLVEVFPLSHHAKV